MIEATRNGIRAITVGAADNAAAGAITIAHAGTIRAGYGIVATEHPRHDRHHDRGDERDREAASEDGILALNASGSITVGNAGRIDAGQTGILASSDFGNVTVGNAGQISAGQTGILANSANGATSITTGIASRTFGEERGIQAYGRTGTTIRNFGSITAGLANDRLAIDAAGAATALYNAGRIEGRIALTANADTVTNRGLFTTAGINDLRGGDVFLNQGGTVSLLGTATEAHFSGLERFENAGLVTMSNGRVGDRIVISGATPGSASFQVVNGGRLAVDVSPGGADVLVVDGAITGTGTNSIIVRNVGAPAAFNPANRIVVVDFDPNKVHGRGQLAHQRLHPGPRLRRRRLLLLRRGPGRCQRGLGADGQARCHDLRAPLDHVGRAVAMAHLDRAVARPHGGAAGLAWRRVLRRHQG